MRAGCAFIGVVVGMMEVDLSVKDIWARAAIVDEIL